jgi:hypothetical protein
MRRRMAFIALLLALTGSPLRQAEAASDLSRELAESVGPVDLGPVDGGVGDDPDVGMLKASDALDAGGLGDPGTPAILPPSLPPIASHPGLCEARRRRCRASWPPIASSRRLAWLGVFLF